MISDERKFEFESEKAIPHVLKKNFEKALKCNQPLLKN